MGLRKKSKLCIGYKRKDKGEELPQVPPQTQCPEPDLCPSAVGEDPTAMVRRAKDRQPCMLALASLL